MTFIQNGLVAGLLLGVSVGAAGAQAPELDAVGMCPDSLSSLSEATGVLIGCQCPAEASGGSVWGSNPYTADSKFCTAAHHAGVVPEGGGVVWAAITEGLQSYEGSERNGVKTSNYGSYRGSVSFAGAPESPTLDDAALDQCPGDMRGKTAPIKCHCPASMLGSGSVWGTDIYTEDSAVCRAALHAGVITTEGGNVTAVPIAGQQQYTASERNGVSSRDYGSWGASYILTP